MYVMESGPINSIMKLEIKEKAWGINPSNLREPWFADTDTAYYGTRGQAKLSALCDHDSMVTTDNEDLCFLNIRVRRRKKYDKYVFRGEILSKEDIDYITRKEKRDIELIKLLEDNPDGKAFIYAGCHGAYWGWNSSGYMSDKYKAGIYDLKDAVDTVKNSCLDRREHVELIDVDKHNKIIRDRMEDLKRYLL